MLKQVRALHSAKAHGQAMVEYALILALVALALAAIFVVTGSAVGNVFSNTVYNLVGQDPNAVVQLTKYGGPNAFWETVTWVAQHPYQVTLAATLVKNPSATATDGPSPTPSDTSIPRSPTATATYTPSPTYADTSYRLPFFDPVDNANSLRTWRLDNSVYLGGGAWKGQYFHTKDFTGDPVPGTPDYTYWNYQIDPAYTFNINFDWGTNRYPIQNASITWPTNRSAGFSIIYTRDIYLATGANLRFTAAAADSVVVKLDGLPIITRTSPATLDTPITPYEAAVSAGPHTLEVDYAELDGNEAGVKLDITAAGGGTGAINPDDNVTSDPASKCQWGPLKSANSDSVEYMFDDDTTSTDGVGPNLTCNLELRGSIDLGTAPNPVLTFWDVWDFTGSGATAKLQVAEYKADRSMAWTTIDLHGGDANYNWTRQAVNLSSFIGKKIALRFVITNPGDTSGKRRWYVDDIGVAQQTDPAAVTVGKFWDLNSVAQAGDFITDARWALTSNHTYGTGTAWDDSPGMAPAVFSEGTPRVHYIELKSLVDLSAAPAKDLENDSGEAELSFWSMYNLNVGTKIQVEWTTDPRDTTTQDQTHWTLLGTAPIADATFAQKNSGTNMSFYELPLGSETGVPQTQKFRLRFAMYLDSTTTWADTSGGWWIDNIYLERASPPQFAAYPFTDNADTAANLAAYWLTPGSWGRAVGQGRSGSTAYADSPTGNYQPNGDNPIQMKKYLDLNNDSVPDHAPLYGATPVKPTLTFWQWRNIAAGTTLSVDMFISLPHQDGGLWYPIWTYIAGSSHTPIGADDQEAWERVQIDLIKAYEDATGLSWSTISTNDDVTDDDVRLEFRVQSSGSQVADGMSIDDINVSDYAEDEFHLWATTKSVSGFNGNGTSYPDTPDDFENSVARGAWNARWYNGGEWDTVTHPGSVNNLAATDSKGRNYHAHELSIMELKKIIDLRGVDAADQPVAYAWMLRKLDDTANFSWQISWRDGSTDQAYDKILGWTAWTPALSSSDIGNENESWQRVQINLLPYLGREIKLRLVLNTTGSTGSTSDGIYLDDVQFAFISEQRIFPLPFHDVAQSTYNWATEGQWGLAPDRFRGSENSSAPLGNNDWQETYISCDIIDTVNLCNNDLSKFTQVEALADNPATLAANPGSVLTNTVGDPLLRSYSPAVPSRPNNSSDPKWSTQWVARVTRDVTVEAPASFDFTILANDGVKAKIEGPIGGSAGDQVNPTSDWNLILDWNKNDGVAQADTPVTLPAGNYKITVDWLQNLGNAFMSFSVADSNFSFTDTPNTANGSGGYDVVKAPNNSDSSLLLKGALDLHGVTQPVLQYYTEYEIGTPNVSSSTQARVEVSTDGGFTWTSAHLGDALGPTPMDNPVINGGSQLTDWLRKDHNLSSYVGNYVNLRFRLVTKTEPDSISITGWHDGWYITEIDINQ